VLLGFTGGSGNQAWMPVEKYVQIYHGLYRNPEAVTMTGEKLSVS
jgi:hypothetical protein